MRAMTHKAIAFVVFFAFLAAPATAQESEKASQTVKVALLDMSSIAGPGAGRPGMMGPGFQRGDASRGPGAGRSGTMGPGMMGPGWNWGGGQGPGWMAQHMMGPGMMGMGMMSIRTNAVTAMVGKIRFEVTNYSASLLHEMEIVAVDNVNAPLPYDYNTAKVVPDEARVRGEVEDIGPGGEKVLEVTLPLGDYLLICNLPGHYAAGMVAPFTVTE